MLLKPKPNRVCSKEDFENKLIIEKWIKRNSSNKVTIGKNTVESETSNYVNKFTNKNKFPDQIDVSISKKEVLKFEQLDESASRQCKKSSDSVIIKRLSNSSFGTSKRCVSKTKICRLTLPEKSSNVSHNNSVQSIIKRATLRIPKTSTCVAITNIGTDSKIASPKIKSEPTRTEIFVSNPVKSEVNENGIFESKPIDSKSTTVISDILATTPTKRKDSANMENNLSSYNSIKNVLCQDDDSDVYTSLLDNYRYLITPKAWSVTEFVNDKKERYILFFNVHVIKEKDTLITVMRKSLVINKGAVMNYSVHGLPVDINGTILPKILDNTKKLLSILHIFDKMPVCEGLGGDLNIKQTDFIFKDSCRFWRHKNCKIVLLKTTRCPVCTEMRNYILEKKL